MEGLFQFGRSGTHDRSDYGDSKYRNGNTGYICRTSIDFVSLASVQEAVSNRLADRSVYTLNRVFNGGKMKTFSSNKGFTLIELLLAISLISLFIATVIPSMLQFRQRELNWRDMMHLEQEAIRFFTYFENRNASAKTWNIQGNQITIELAEQRNGRPLIKRIYQLGDRIIETDIPMGGTLIMAQMVHDIRYTQNGSSINITLTLSKDGTSQMFHGVFMSSVEK